MIKSKKDPVSTFDIKYYESIPSTNTLARQHAIEGAQPGLVIVADHQTKGRGRGANTWESPPGKNLLFSLLIRPKIAINKAPFLTQTVCRAIAKILEQKEIHPEYKKPNDLLVDGKKICGILIEAISNTNKELESVVIGVGLNVNAEKNELLETATSMKMLRGIAFDRPTLLNDVLFQLKHDLKDYCE